jgi:hypothetical protein
MDEQPIQLIKEVRTPLPAGPNHIEKYDYEYQRNGTANVFMFTEPLNGWRKVSIREKKKKEDWAMEIRSLLTDCYPETDRVILVCDNYNTHTIGALFKTFAPEEASALMKRLEIHHTPKHGSWLNIAEIELSAFTRQCLGEDESVILICSGSRLMRGNGLAIVTKNLLIGNLLLKMLE